MVICLTKYLLSDKHHLARIWLAAHWEKKIKKTQIFEVDIERSIQDIMEAEIILDLRISGHLLVGIVKIHSRKSKYLLNECNSIFYQVRIFHTGRIDLPDNRQTASLNDITLDVFLDNFNNIENDLVNFDIENNIMDDVLTNQCHIEDITLKEASESLTLIDDTDIVDFSFREEDAPFDNLDESLMSLNVNLKDPKNVDDLLKGNGTSAKKKSIDAMYSNITCERKLEVVYEHNDKDNFDAGITLECPETEIPESIELPANVNDDINQDEEDHFDIPSTHFNDETDELNLEPVMIASTSSNSKCNKLKKRKHIVDYKKCMSYKIIKKQVLDTSDITCAFEVAPVSKRMMILKETGSANNLFHLPAIKLQNPKLLKLYQHNLKTCQSDNFELLSEEEGSVQMPRKKSRRDTLAELAVNDSLLENLDVSSVSNRMNTSFPAETNVPDLEDFIVDTDLGNIASDQALEEEIHLPQETVFPDDDISYNDAGGITSTQVSKTSEEKWQYALQNRLIKMLQCLKQLFEKKSVIYFSSLAQKDKLQVAQRFFCLLMLKKFQIICLEQSDAFKDISISSGLNFDSACLKYCCT